MPTLYLDQLLKSGGISNVRPGSSQLYYQQAPSGGRSYNLQQPPAPPASVLGASTGPAFRSGGGGAAPAAAPVAAGPDPNALANGQAQARLALIQERLNNLRGTVGAQKGEAQSYLTETLGNIGSTYGNLVQSGKDKLGTIMSNLGQERVGVENQYGQAAGKARRAIENAITRNRMVARATNRLDSSFYDDRYNNLQEEGRGTQAELGSEQASKITGIGTRQTEAQNDFARQEQALQLEQKQLEQQAQREARQRIMELEDLEPNAGIDASLDKEDVVSNLYSTLDSIRGRAEQQRMQLLGLIAQGGETARNFISNYNAISPQLSQILGMNQGLSRAGNIGQAAGDIGFAPQADTQSYLANVGRRLPPDEEERLRLLGIRR